MKTLVITEGKLDQVLLKNILDADPPKHSFEVLAAGAASTAVSLARSYLATGDTRTALVLDAETTDQEQLPAKHALVADLLAGIASPDRFLVLLMVPAIESVLFTDRGEAGELFGKELNDEEWTEAKYEPKLTLGRMIQGTPTRIINLSKFERLLQEHDLKPFARSQPMRRLLSFISDPLSKKHSPLRAG
jgi:hypothetical protein